MTEAKREQVRQVVGVETEELIAGLHITEVEQVDNSRNSRSRRYT
jgi:hypothetical protein